MVGATNDAVDNCTGPTLDLAALDSVLGVGVADFRDRIGGAGYGPCIDLVAPSKPEGKTTLGVLTTDRTGIDGHTGGDYHETFGGTSAAAPLVAGIAGLLLSLNPELTRSELTLLLEQTADKIDAARAGYDARGFSTRAGFGRVNAARALVPNVAIVVTPSIVQAGEAFTVTVTASAPFGLDSISWLVEGVPATSHERQIGGQVFESVTFGDVTLDRAGTFVLTADARDRRSTSPLPGYPHAASQTGRSATAMLTVISAASTTRGSIATGSRSMKRGEPWTIRANKTSTRLLPISRAKSVRAFARPRKRSSRATAPACTICSSGAPATPSSRSTSARTRLRVVIEKLRSGTPRGTRALLAGYLRGIALKLWGAQRRKEVRRATTADSDAIEAIADDRADPEERLSEEQLGRAVRELLAELSTPRDRDILTRVYLLEEDKEAVCAALGVDSLHFNRVLFRAKQRFRELVERAKQHGELRLVR